MAMANVYLGINGAYHECAAALVHDGQVLCAIEDERLSRVKHGKSASIHGPRDLPWGAIRAVFDTAGIEPRQIAGIAYSLLPNARESMLGIDPPGTLDIAKGWGNPKGERRFNDSLKTATGRLQAAVG